jgi:hypothetical protein
MASLVTTNFKMRMLSALLSLAVSQAFAQTSDIDVLDMKDVPQIVSDKVTCSGPDTGMTRRAFAGGFVFAAPCPGNHANYIQALVFAEDVSGRNARLLMFPQPGRKGEGNPADSLSNVRWYGKQREVTELFVNPESKVCRTEGRWRLNSKAQPQLVFWRQTRDCDGKRGWQVIVDQRR